MRKIGAVIAAVTLMTSFAANADPILEVGGDGRLDGLLGLDVDGTLYNVTLLDGTCAANYDGCDAASDFAFNTRADAIDASQAILDALVGTVFEHAPTMIRGCTNIFNCFMNTPYGLLEINFVSAPARLRGGSADNVALDGLFQFSPTRDFSDSDTGTLAVWSRATAVPEPATLALFGLGLAGIGISRRFRRS